MPFSNEIAQAAIKFGEEAAEHPRLNLVSLAGELAHGATEVGQARTLPSKLPIPSSAQWMEDKLQRELPISSISGNPFLDRFQLAVSRDSYKWKSDLTHHYAHAVPTNEALSEVARHAPIVEIGAGNGYWAALARARQVPVVAYDNWTGSAYEARSTWTEVRAGDESALAAHPGHTLMLSWPSQNGVAGNALERHLAQGGKTLIYIGEPDAEIMADDAFFQTLETRMQLTRQITIPKWAGNKDAFHVYKAKDSSIRA